MQFPALVFRSPGPNRHSSGGTYRFAQVQDAEELEAILAQGYHVDVRAAIVAAGERAFTHGLTSTQARKVPVAKLLARLQARLAEDAVPAQTVEVQEPILAEPAVIAATGAVVSFAVSYILQLFLKRK